MNYYTYESRSVCAGQERKSARNVNSWRGDVITDWNKAVTDFRSEWKEDVRDIPVRRRSWCRCCVSLGLYWDSEDGQQQQKNQPHICLSIISETTGEHW